MTEATPAIAADGEAARTDAELVLEFFATVLTGDRNVAAVDRFLAADFVDHDADRSDTGRSGVAAKLAALWSALPGAAFRPLQAIAAGGYVAVRSELVGGEHPVPFADTYRVSAGRIVEHWHVVGS